MKVKAVRLYGVDDLRLEEFDLPEIQDDEILVKVMTDSLCMSTWKTVKQGEKHKRVPEGIDKHPIIVGHEFAGDIVKVGKKWQDQYKAGEKFTQQPAIRGQIYSIGYSYEYLGGNATYAIFPNHVIEKGSLLKYDGEAYFEASVSEPMSCIVGGCRTNFHTGENPYEHLMGTKKGGSMIILGGCGPMGLGAITYAQAMEQKPARLVVTEISDERIARAKKVLPEAEAAKNGVELIYVNTAQMEDQVKGLLDLNNGQGYDDVFIYAPIRGIAEVADKIAGFDSCINLFAGPIDAAFSAEMNLYECHYSRRRIVGSSGGLTEDMMEILGLIEQKAIKPAVMITHIGGLDAVADATIHLPEIPGGKKLIYTQIEMPLTAIEDFKALGETNPLYAQLAESCENHQGLWNAQAEQILLNYYGIK